MTTDKEPVFVPTREQRYTVCNMVASNWTHGMIAKDLGISQTILKRHFKDELEKGHEQVRARALMKIAEAGFKGARSDYHLPSLKVILAVTGGAKGAEKEPERKAPEVRFGKKQTQKLQAEAANAGVFATPLPPTAVKTVQ